MTADTCAPPEIFQSIDVPSLASAHLAPRHRSPGSRSMVTDPEIAIL
jgi:hypothetical protein